MKQQYAQQPTFDPFQSFEAQQDAQKPILIQVPDPPIGNKAVLIKERGIYVLEAGPASLRSMACTHAGSGGIVVYDGVPDEGGKFPHLDARAPDSLPDEFFQSYIDDRMREPGYSAMDERWKAIANMPPEQYDQMLKDARREYSIWYESRNGREIYYAHPACMGMWMLDAGCRHGITVHNLGSHDGSSPILTLTWMAIKQKKVA